MAPKTAAFLTLRPIFDELRGPRVRIRPYRLSDAEARFDAVEESREQLRPWEPEQAEACRSVEASRDWIIRARARWLVRERFAMGLWDHTTSQYVGGIGLRPREPDGWTIPAFAIGYWIRAFNQGQGYITEAVGLVLTYTFTVLGAQRIEIVCDADNVRSAAVAQRLGLQLEGRLRNVWRRPDGTLGDELVFAALAADYQTQL